MFLKMEMLHVTYIYIIFTYIHNLLMNGLFKKLKYFGRVFLLIFETLLVGLAIKAVAQKFYA